MALDAFDFEQLVVSTTAVSMTRGKIMPSGKAPAACATISVSGDSIRYRIDGGEPTSSVGHQLEAGDYITISGINNLLRFKAIRSGTVDAIVDVTYYA